MPSISLRPSGVGAPIRYQNRAFSSTMLPMAVTSSGLVPPEASIAPRPGRKLKATIPKTNQPTMLAKLKPPLLRFWNIL